MSNVTYPIVTLPTLYTIDQVSEHFHLESRTIRQWITDGKLKYVKLGGSIRILEDDLIEFIDKCRTSTGSERPKKPTRRGSRGGRRHRKKPVK